MTVYPIGKYNAFRAQRRIALLQRMTVEQRAAYIAKMAEYAYENQQAAVAAAMAEDGDEKFNRVMPSR